MTPPDYPLGSRPTQQDAGGEVVAALFEDRVGARARGLDVLEQVRPVRPLPDPARDLDRLEVGEHGIAVEVGLGLLEGAVAQREEALEIPALDVVLLRVEVEGEVDEVADVDAPRAAAEHV